MRVKTSHFLTFAAPIFSLCWKHWASERHMVRQSDSVNPSSAFIWSATSTPISAYTVTLSVPTLQFLSVHFNFHCISFACLHFSWLINSFWCLHTNRHFNSMRRLASLAFLGAYIQPNFYFKLLVKVTLEPLFSTHRWTDMYCFHFVKFKQHFNWHQLLWAFTLPTDAWFD